MGQLLLLAVTGKWPQHRAGGNAMRGIDFYPWQDLVRALVRAAKLFKLENGYLPPLASPTSFNEHILFRKFFAPLPMPSLADKLTAKDYVKARLSDKFLPTVAWVGDDVGGLFVANQRAGRYLLKATHGSNSQHLLLNLPDDLSAKHNEIVQWAMNQLASRYGYDWGEWQYCTFKPRLFLEQFIDFNGDQSPEDYKFYCFHGKTRVIEVDVDRFTQLRSALYTRDWEYIPVTYGEPPIQRARPCNLEDMLRVAEAIAAGMDFARIDLYTDGISQIRFGEITVTPGNAYLHFSDFKFDRWLGSQFSKESVDNMPWISDGVCPKSSTLR
jgi:TupA-like ATPgrasp